MLHLTYRLDVLYCGCITFDRVSCVISSNLMYHSPPKASMKVGSPPRPLRVFTNSHSLAPSFCCWTRPGRGFPLPCGSLAFLVDVEWSIRYTRSTRTVKVTYRGPVFFCLCLLSFGVGRCLGVPSGGLSRWQTNGSEARRREPRWPRLPIHLLGLPSAVSSIWAEPPCPVWHGHDRTSTWLSDGVRVLLLEEVSGTVRG